MFAITDASSFSTVATIHLHQERRASVVLVEAEPTWLNGPGATPEELLVAGVDEVVKQATAGFTVVNAAVDVRLDVQAVGKEVAFGASIETAGRCALEVVNNHLAEEGKNWREVVAKQDAVHVTVVFKQLVSASGLIILS